MRARYLGLWQRAAAGELASWEKSDDGALALVIVLDQFPRNMFRGHRRGPMPAMRWRAMWRGAPSTAASTRGSIRLCANFSICPSCIRKNWPTSIRCIELLRQAGLTENAKWAEHHAEIIRRFGRFPHRNDILGRATTPDEQAFLDEGGFAPG